MRFIELTNSVTNKHVFINIHNILTIERIKDITSINMIDEFIEVLETPDEIMLKIRG